MKIQHLAVIFILIMMPIIIVFNEYLNNQITVVNTEATYDARLLNSTYDAVKAFQLNTINTTSYTAENRVKNMEAAVNTFFNSLVTSFKYEGNRSDVMKEYVPAVVLTMYDGYYIYSPFENTLTNVKDNDQDGDGIGDQVDDDYKNSSILSGLKPYVSYTCNYNYRGKTYMITYSMDNYIVVDVFDGNKHTKKEGYLLEGVKEITDGYSYDGCEFKKNANAEQLKEFLGDKEYFYVEIDGTKYYYEDDSGRNYIVGQPASTGRIFYMSDSGEKIYRYSDYSKCTDENRKKFKEEYYNEIIKNNSAFYYYKEAYDFTKWVKDNLSDLKISDIDPNSPNYAGYDFTDVDKIFDMKSGDDSFIEDSNSNFNRHRADVIRAIITTNLSSAISGFGRYSKSGEEFIMPKISETDWELLENNICMATFLQGLRVVGGKAYNSYSVVPNNFNKEYVDENDIYILKKAESSDENRTYAKPNDSTLNDNIAIPNDSSPNNAITYGGLTYQPGVFKINIERRKNEDGVYFNPISYDIQFDGYINSPYLESYTSMTGSSKLNSITTIDMYRYMRNGVKKKDGTTFMPDNAVKRAYYTALGRERYGSYKFTK